MVERIEADVMMDPFADSDVLKSRSSEGVDLEARFARFVVSFTYDFHLYKRPYTLFFI